MRFNGLSVVLEELRILAMPRKKRDRLDKINSQIITLSEHLSKLLLIPDEESYNGWVRTVDNCLTNIRFNILIAGKPYVSIKECEFEVSDITLSYSGELALYEYVKKSDGSVRHYKYLDTELQNDLYKIAMGGIKRVYSGKSFLIKNNPEFKDAANKYSKRETEVY